MSTAVIVLAAGKGTRMKSKKPKVLHKVAGREMVLHVLEAGKSINPSHLITIIGHGSESVSHRVGKVFPETICVVQKQQLGTGHAVLQTEEELKNFTGNVIILCGDCPLVDEQLVADLMNTHNEQGNAVTFVSAFAENPAGLGRVIRDDEDEVTAIIEHKDATEEQRSIDEINTGIYAVKAPLIFNLLKEVKNTNNSEEYYITDIVELALAQNELVGTYTASDAESLLGVNSRLQLACMEDLYQNRLREHFMSSGATMVDPQSVFFAWDTKIGHDVHIGPNVQFGPYVTIESNVTIEGNCYFEDSYINENAMIYSFCHFVGAEIANEAKVGPFARLRQGAEVFNNAKVGSFVEVKKSLVGINSSVAHLSYIGDAKIGNNVNIGGGTITCNYDGANKHKTTIEDNVFVGSNNSLVAPVIIKQGATTAAGGTITKDVSENSLAFGRAKQTEKANYARPKKNIE